MNPYQVVEDFEQALCEYTGARYAVTTTSCTMALLLACKWFHAGHNGFHKRIPITIPNRTYVSVPMSIKHAGFDVQFTKADWIGYYQLSPFLIYDSARHFTSDMYIPGSMMCLSFHWSKHLGIGQGGAILLDDHSAYEWLRKMRFDGRTEGVAPKDDHFNMIGYHAYMSPRDAAEGLSKLAVLPKDNEPLPNDDYPDLSTMSIFQ